MQMLVRLVNAFDISKRIVNFWEAFRFVDEGPVVERAWSIEEFLRGSPVKEWGLQRQPYQVCWRQL